MTAGQDEGMRKGEPRFSDAGWIQIASIPHVHSGGHSTRGERGREGEKEKKTDLRRPAVHCVRAATARTVAHAIL